MRTVHPRWAGRGVRSGALRISRGLTVERTKAVAEMTAKLAGLDGTVARWLLEQCTTLTVQIKAVDAELGEHVAELATTLLEICRCGTATPAKTLRDTAYARRFRPKDAYARYGRTAPLAVWSSNHPRHRLSRVGNRQPNCATHRIALTQAHRHPQARAYLQPCKDAGDTAKQTIRALKRRPSDGVYQTILADAERAAATATPQIAAQAASHTSELRTQSRKTATAL